MKRRSVNEQLGLPLSHAANGPLIYQVSMFNNDPEEDHLYNGGIVPGVVGFRNMGGWDVGSKWKWHNLYGTEKCQDECKSIFPIDKALMQACKNKCKSRCNQNSKCPGAYRPTRSDICIDAGLGADCSGTVITPVPGDDTLPSGDGAPGSSPTTTGSGGMGTSRAGGMSMPAKIGIGVGIVAAIFTVGAIVRARRN